MGLGLFISHHVIELHGGTIQAETPAGGGTRFVVHMPLRVGSAHTVH
jgi:signal transduction histidine kinase